MTKMAATPIYGKNLLKIFFSETSKLMTFKLGIQCWGLWPYKVCSNDDWPWPLYFCMGKCLNTRFYRNYWSLWTESWYSCWLSDYMDTYEYQRSRSLFDFCQRSLRLILSVIFCCEAARPIKAKFHVEFLWVERMKICSNGLVIWPRWPPCPYMVKTL